MSTLYLVRGLPGSGKSTMARMISDVHFEADMYHMVGDKYVFVGENIKAAHEWCYQSTRIFLNRVAVVAVSNTFTTLKEMQRYLDFQKDGHRIAVIRCTGEFGNIHNVPADVMEKMKARFEDYPGELLYNGDAIMVNAA